MQPSHNTLQSAVNKSTNFTTEGQACGLLGFLPVLSSSPHFSSYCTIPSFMTKLPLKLNTGYFKQSKKGETECTSSPDTDGKQMVQTVISVTVERCNCGFKKKNPEQDFQNLSAILMQDATDLSNDLKNCKRLSPV